MPYSNCCYVVNNNHTGDYYISQYLLHTKLEYRPRVSGLVISYIFVFIAENIDVTCKRALTT